MRDIVLSYTWSFLIIVRSRLNYLINYIQIWHGNSLISWINHRLNWLFQKSTPKGLWLHRGFKFIRKYQHVNLLAGGGTSKNFLVKISLGVKKEASRCYAQRVFFCLYVLGYKRMDFHLVELELYLTYYTYTR